MQSRQLDFSERTGWNAFVAKDSNFALLQSWEWGEFKEKLGWMAFRVAVESNGCMEAGAQMLIKPMLAGRVSVAYVPRGPVGDWLNKETASCLLSELHRIARAHNAVFLKIEPPLIADPELDHLLRQYHFRPSDATNQPQATIILDLSLDQDKLLMQMRKKTRQYIRRAQKERITVSVGREQDLPAYYELMRRTGRREEFAARSWEYYREEWKTLAANEECVLLLAHCDGRLVAARTAYRFGAHAAEFHAGSVDDAEGLHPNYLLVWEAMNWAKSQGCQTYDMWGVPNDIGEYNLDALESSNRTDGLWGVYRFKRGFSKNVVNYIGAYDLVYSPVLYALIANKLFSGDAQERISIWLDKLRGD